MLMGIVPLFHVMSSTNDSSVRISSESTTGHLDQRSTAAEPISVTTPPDHVGLERKPCRGRAVNTPFILQQECRVHGTCGGLDGAIAVPLHTYGHAIARDRRVAPRHERRTLATMLGATFKGYSTTECGRIPLQRLVPKTQSGLSWPA